MNISPPSARPLRILNLEGGCNFRDLGGYRTRDGRELEWGRVYRTGVLCNFTSDAHSRLHQLGVRAICDLRLASEREREQTRWPDANTRHLNWDDGSAPPTVGMFAANHPYTAAGVHAAMIDYYRALPAWMVPRFRGMFERIAHGDVPVLVHCSVGKDRTGMAIALLLTVLDVSHETILEDYLLTNDSVDLVQYFVTQHRLKVGDASAHHPLLTMPEDILRTYFKGHADYLHAAFDQIAREHGDVSTYLRQELGVDDAVRSKVRAALLNAG